MPTPSEQKALGFIAAIALLAAGVRVLGAGPTSEPSAVEQQALARQATAADSAASAQRHAKSKSGRSRRLVASRTCDTVAKIIGGVATVPPPCAPSVRPRGRANERDPTLDARGFPPPERRIDSHAAQARVTTSAASARLDLDVATERDIDRLRGIGPTLARRIVANRDSFGPFRSLDGLRRVRGLGGAAADRLAPDVSFSGTPAPERE